MREKKEALAHIRSLQPDPSRFIQWGRGYVDWKFSQVAAYIGYAAARDYADTMRRWHDYQAKYQGCTLDRTYQDFLEAETSITNQPST